ncbi:hypothetical protein [Ottowia oryzae]
MSFVHYISSAMRGAPVVNNAAGSLTGALSALLHSGWAVTSAASISVLDGTATVAVPPGQSFEVGAFVQVQGSTLGGIDGVNARVLSATSSSITFATAAANGSYSGGGMTVKYASHPQWERAFLDGNVAVYRSTHPLSSGFCYRVKDPAGQVALVRGFESMSDAQTGVAPFPTVDMAAGEGLFWAKSYSNNSNPINYLIGCDGQSVIVNLSPTTGVSDRWLPYGFGKAVPLAADGDAWAEFVVGSTSGSFGIIGGNHRGTLIENAMTGGRQQDVLQVLARPPGGVGGATKTFTRAYIGWGEGSGYACSGDNGALGALGSAPDGQILFSRMYFPGSMSGAEPRADVPGVLYVPQTDALAIGSRVELMGTGGLAGRRLVCLPTRNAGAEYLSSPPSGAYFFDITGPWK